jgi:hypothetical protein
MRKIAFRSVMLTAVLVASSAPVLAHVGEHGAAGVGAGLMHMLIEHGHWLALSALVVAALIAKYGFGNR